MTAKARSVLVVDDDQDIRETVADVLSEEGYAVMTAGNGREALELLLTSRTPAPGVILLDLMMPEMDGAAFRAEQLKVPNIAGIPVIVFSAHGTVLTSADVLNAAGYVKKPLRMQTLIDAIEAVVTV